MSYLNLISLLGIPVMLLLAWLMSSHRTKVNLRLVVLGVLLQFALAAVLFQSQNWTFDGAFENGILFAGVDRFFGSLISFVEAGTGFVFRINVKDHANPMVLMSTFAFGVLPTVVFFAALMSILYHIGLMQIVIRAMAWVMQKTLGTTGPESLAAAANVLVGHTEAPLVVKPYVAGMTRSELNALMVGGFSTITGSLMAIFVAEGISAGHLLSASIISAPAALVIAKILQPETEETADASELVAQMEQPATNVIEAAAIGASDGMKLAINIAAMLLAFLALIAMVDAMLAGVGNLIQWLILLASDRVIEIDWSLNRLFGAVFYPLAWIMGIEAGDCSISGQLLGKKIVVNEFVAFLGLAEVSVGDAATAADSVTISERTKVILTYALCGFSNFGAIGIQIGGIGPLAPKRRSDLAQLGLRAMLGGMLACCMTACMAGLLYGVLK